MNPAGGIGPSGLRQTCSQNQRLGESGVRNGCQS